MSEWKTIDSAPKDVTEILAYDGDFSIAKYIDGDWWCDIGYILNPTHWMPLPNPPSDDT